ncbi:Protein of unknown function [Clostridium cavendishii DSM 21758]|uniref:DUF2508 domain-containing protein n=1 Tax=Clostridium cavendishii DSM 21758 TaxID=1121302 RepID=A0A1M6SYF1_9CLOT|nr:DUF2508 family protein [Clostridium cavendishii]SHK49568.1 Protein of unknown function [Clostridium cavendishii DSM 21758]
MNKYFIVEYLTKKMDKEKCNEEILQAIENAKLEMESTRNAFEYAEDKKLIEAAIYNHKASIAKYEYLLLKAREKGIKVDYNYILAKS